MNISFLDRTRVTYPTLRIALRNSKSVWSAYRPRSKRKTERIECMTLCESANGGWGRVGKENGKNSIEDAYIVLIPMPQGYHSDVDECHLLVASESQATHVPVRSLSVIRATPLSSRAN